MIASDYLRCARSDVEARKRADEIEWHLRRLLEGLVPPEMMTVAVMRIMGHYQVSCYTPGEEK